MSGLELPPPLREAGQGTGDDKTHHQRGILRTPFHAHAQALNEREQWEVRGGYLTARCYSDLELEHAALRNAVAVADHSWLTKYHLAGADAQRLLERLCTGRVASLGVGRTRYVMMCQENGGVRDDGLLMRLSEDQWRLVTAHRHLDWLSLNARGLAALTVRDDTDAVAVLALYGPLSCALLEALGLTQASQLAPGQWTGVELEGTTVQVSRTSFAGDVGYELWLPWGQAQFLWPRVFAAAQGRAVAAGREAIELARLEAGIVLSGCEFEPAHLATDPACVCSPLELGQERLIDWRRVGFNGYQALRAQAHHGRHRHLVPLLVDGVVPPARGTLITNFRRRPVGAITSAAWSPAAKQNVALAILDAGVSVERDGLRTTVDAWDGFCRHLRRVRVRPHRGPFYDPPTRRITPPF